MYYERVQVQESTMRSLLSAVFMWMGVALSITGLLAWFVYDNEAVRQAVLGKPAVVMGLLIAQLAVVIFFSFMIYRVSFATALALFVAYAALTGVTLSSIFVVYTTSSIAATFFVAAGMFAGAGLYGYFTRSDLSSIGSLFGMALWGIILAMLVNMFVQSASFNLVISGVAVLLFTGLTAYDIQRIKQISGMMIQDNQMHNKIALIGALTLYLDFLNLFLSLLQFSGRRKE